MIDLRNNETLQISDIADLHSELRPLLQDPNVTDVAVLNGEVWYDVITGGDVGMIRLAEFDMSPEKLEALIRTISGVARPHKPITNTNPILSCELPGDGSRVKAILEPVSQKGPCLYLRMHRARGMTLDQYLLAGAVSAFNKVSIEAAVDNKETIVVAGRNGSGKTTCLGAILDAYNKSYPTGHLVTIEDMLELLVPSPCWSRQRTIEGEVTARELLRHSLQERPDRFVVGELLGPVAYDFLMAANAGNPGLATVHSANPKDVMTRLMSLAGMAIDVSRLTMGEIASAVDLVVFCEHRRISGVWRVNSYGELARD